MEELLKLMIASSLKDFEKQTPKTDGAKKVDIDKIKEKITQKSIDEAAAHIKKLYDSFVTVGFNEVQAFELVKVQLSSMRISR